MTFLFTDIEGSTRRWEADADAMRAALEAHNQTLREAVKAHDGQVFNYTGDGMCAVFASPRPAVDAAVAAQRALELPVRMGIATGEAELRGDDYFGTVLNRTARVMAAGPRRPDPARRRDGGSAQLASTSSDLGPRRLRDIARPVEVFQVRARGLRTEFPPLKTLDSTPGNLKPPDRPVSSAASWPIAELETATQGKPVGDLDRRRRGRKDAAGVGGGRAPEIRLPRRRLVIELAPVGDPAAVPEATAAVLGITPQAGLSLSDSIATVMEGRSRLLVFDNCEHVLDAAADLIEAIIEHSSTVRVLATSREGLGVADEQLWPVPALDVNAGVDSEAATLFVERASMWRRRSP